MGGEIAEAEHVTCSFVNRLLRLTLIAPDIVEAVLDGRQPEGMQLEELTRTMPSNVASNRRAVAAELDVTVPDRITAVIGMAETRFGRIDVLVNNAGYGYLATIEEGEEDEVRAMFETNVFGLVNMTKAVLPGMRSRRSGHIVNMI